MEDLTLGGIVSYIGLICLWIVIIWQLRDWRKRKKEKTYEYVPKDNWWKQTYIWQVFFRRPMYRPVSTTFAWLIFIVPAIFIIVFSGINFTIGHPLKLEEMHQVSGTVTKAHRSKGRGSHDYIKLKDDMGNEKTYNLCCFYYDEEAEEFKQKIQDTQTRVDIWYEEDKGFLWENYNYLRELKVKNEFVSLNKKIHFQYDYQHFLKQYINSLSNLLWGLVYSLPGWIWLWLLNKKELPIHRLNKQKRYKKYNLKDK